MISTRPNHPSSVRHRQIGRKVLQADRLARALGSPTGKSAKRIWRFPSVKPKVLMISGAALVIIISASVFGARAYMAQVAAKESAAAAIQIKQVRAKSAAANACRQQKVEQKADQLGKITYDELYDYDDCEK
jgi:hypothetical protein